MWTKIVHNLRGSLDNIKGNTQWAKLQRLEFHAIWTKEYFMGGFLPIWSSSTLHQSIYLNPHLELITWVITYMYMLHV